MAVSRYNDSEYEYRHVQLPKAMLKAIPEDYQDASKGTLKLLWEEEWRALGITQVGFPAAPRPKSRLDLGTRPGSANERNRVWVGNTMKSTSPSLTFCYSSKHLSLCFACLCETV